MKRIFDLKNASLTGILWRISTLELGVIGTLAGFFSKIDSYSPEAKQKLILLSKLLKIVLNNLELSLLIFLLINLLFAYLLRIIFKKLKNIQYQTKPKNRMEKRKDLLLILASINTSTKWFPLAKYEELNLEEMDFRKYLNKLLNKKLIKQDGVFEIRKGWKTSEMFILTEKGLNFLNKHISEIQQLCIQ